MFCDTQTIIDRAIAALGIKPGRAAQIFSRYARETFRLFRTMLRLGNEGGPILELRPVATLANECLVEQPFGDDHMRQCREHRNVGARQQRQVESRLHMWRAHKIDTAGIDDDQLCALT